MDEVRYVDEMPAHLRTMTSATPTLLLLEGPNTDSGKIARPAAFDGISEFRTDKTILHHQIAECRVIKTPLEQEVLRYASKISSLAHMHVMRTMKAGMKEYQAESTFLHHVYFHGGARHVCYNCIAATVLGTMLISSAPVSVTRMSSSIRTPPVPRNWLILSATRNLLISGSVKARSIRKSMK